MHELYKNKVCFSCPNGRRRVVPLPPKYENCRLAILGTEQNMPHLPKCISEEDKMTLRKNYTDQVELDDLRRASQSMCNRWKGRCLLWRAKSIGCIHCRSNKRHLHICVRSSIDLQDTDQLHQQRSTQESSEPCRRNLSGWCGLRKAASNQMIKPFVLWLHDHRAAPSTCVVGWRPWTGTLRYARKKPNKGISQIYPNRRPCQILNKA